MEAVYPATFPACFLQAMECFQKYLSESEQPLPRFWCLLFHPYPLVVYLFEMEYVIPEIF